jgi:hypothetical protein
LSCPVAASAARHYDFTVGNNSRARAPIKFIFIANSGAARQLGITLPPALLARADEVIE